jgi:hypothetical protein
MADDLDDLPVRAGERASPFVPILILALSFAGWAGFQTTQLVQEKDNLAALHASQDKQVEDSKKLRESLDSLAKSTLVLANRGNANARLVVEELRRRGVTINPDAPPAAPGGAEPKK